ncbi:hypothetical protein [Paenibacillus sp. NPDC058177]|uniref:hypothetical protein n=1 Tax=Paenibacillus sp. NPDC058177 TaxID=3346369 RepID=UPI0036D995F8
MSDWKKEISDKFASIDARRMEIHKPLYALLQELKNEPSIRAVDFDLISEHPLVWSVTINGKTEQINESDVEYSQRPYTDPSDSEISEDKRDVAEVLKEILVRKFK